MSSHLSFTLPESGGRPHQTRVDSVTSYQLHSRIWTRDFRVSVHSLYRPSTPPLKLNKLRLNKSELGCIFSSTVEEKHVRAHPRMGPQRQERHLPPWRRGQRRHRHENRPRQPRPSDRRLPWIQNDRLSRLDQSSTPLKPAPPNSRKTSYNKGDQGGELVYRQLVSLKCLLIPTTFNSPVV